MRARVKKSQASLEASGPRWTYSRRGYALAQSLRQLKRYRLASLGTLLVLGITLCLPIILYFAGTALSTLSERSVQGESLTVYLKNSLSELEGAALADDWQSQGNISRAEYISSEQALAMLEESTDIRNAIELLGTNPLPGAIVIYPQADNINFSDINALANTFRAMPEVDQVQLDLQWIKRLEAAVTLAKLIGALLAAFLTLTALLVIGNTIRLELARRREEMDVARLLGAPDHFMNRAFIYTGAMYGFLGGVIACTIALISLNAIRSPANDLSALYQSAFTVKMPDLSQILLVVFISALLGVAGALSSLYRPSNQLTQSH